MSGDELGETSQARAVRAIAEAAAIGATGAEVGLVVGGPLGGAVAGGTSALLSAWTSVRRGAAQRAERTVEHATALAGVSAEELAAWLEADPARAGLLVAVVEAAARSSSQAHLDALAHVLAHGIVDDARVDEDALAAGALGALGPAHLQVLTIVAREDPEATQQGLTSAYTLQDVWQRRPHLETSIDALMAALVSTGAVRVDATTNARVSGTTFYTATSFGLRCLSFLNERAAPIDDSTGG